MVGADIKPLGGLFLDEDAATTDEEWEEIDNHNALVYERYGERQACDGGRFVHCIDCYAGEYEMFGRALFVSGDARWGSALMPLSSYEVLDQDVQEVRDELKKLLPCKGKEIDELEIRLWVFTHHS